MTIDTGNAATNVIPARCRAALNIRFNDLQTGASLEVRLREEAGRIAEDFGVSVDLALHVSGEAFLTPPGPFTDLVARAVEAETGQKPEMSTTGGTSDARFIRAHCPVLELGLPGPTMHQVDEHVRVADIEALARLYGRILKDYFA